MTSIYVQTKSWWYLPRISWMHHWKKAGAFFSPNDTRRYFHSPSSSVIKVVRYRDSLSSSLRWYPMKASRVDTYFASFNLMKISSWRGMGYRSIWLFELTSRRSTQTHDLPFCQMTIIGDVMELDDLRITLKSFKHLIASLMKPSLHGIKRYGAYALIFGPSIWIRIIFLLFSGG